MIKGEIANRIFKESILAYHLQDHVDAVFTQPYPASSLESLLFHKNWIDTVQWHFEDIVRDVQGTPEYLLSIKRRIDASNQERTDMVEQIDLFLFQYFEKTVVLPNAKLNSETPAWLLDRMSILQLKIYHFQEQTKREAITEEFKQSVQNKLQILLVQEADMVTCFDELIGDISSGHKFMRLYKQMKMYNDPSLNPVLYK